MRVGFRVAKPIDTLLLQQHQQQQEEAGEDEQQQGHGSQLTGQDAVAAALQQAAEQVSTDSPVLKDRVIVVYAPA